MICLLMSLTDRPIAVRNEPCVMPEEFRNPSIRESPIKTALWKYESSTGGSRYGTTLELVRD
jgi:hypothetical protein